MRQKFALIGFSYLIGLIFASVFVSASLIAIISAILLFAAAVILLVTEKPLAVCIAVFTSAVGIVSFTAVYTFAFANAQSISGNTYIANARITDKAYIGNDTALYRLSADIDGKPIQFIMLADNADAKTDDNLKFEAEFSILENTAAFCTADCYLSDGIFLSANPVSEIVITSSDDVSPLGRISDYREYISGKLDSIYPDSAGALMKAIFLSDKSSLRYIDRYNITASGAAHFTAVSGMHLSIIISIISALLTALCKNKFPTVRLIITVFLIIGFSAFFGFTPSVIRSGIMLAMCRCGSLFFRKSDCLNSLGFSVLAITVINPLACTDPALLFTTAACIGAEVLAPRLSEELSVRLYYIPKGFIDIFCCSICASALTAPLTAAYFGMISPYSVFTSIAAIPFMTAALIFLLIFALCGGLLPFIAVPAHLCCYVLNGIFGFIADLPMSHIPADSIGYRYIILICAVICAAAVMLIIRTRKRKAFAAALTSAGFYISVVISFAFAALIPKSGAEIIMSCDGSNGSVLIITDEYCGAVITGNADSAEMLFADMKSRSKDKLSFLAIAQSKQPPIQELDELFGTVTDALIADKDCANQIKSYGYFKDSRIVSDYTAENGIAANAGAVTLNIYDNTVRICSAENTDTATVSIIYGGEATSTNHNGGITCHINKSGTAVQDIDLYYTNTALKIAENGSITIINS